MDTKTFLTELEAESITTLNLLTVIPEDRLNWQPHEKAMTLGQLARHVATIPHRYLEFVDSGSTLASEIIQHPQAKSKENILGLFESSKKAATKILQDADGNWLLEGWKLNNDHEELAIIPRHQFIRSFVLNHLYHHRGELTTYLRTLNAKLPSDYGPTADVNPWK